MMCSLLYFTNSEEVLVFKTVEKKCKLAKAAYLGPNKDEDTNGNDKVIHSQKHEQRFYGYHSNACFFCFVLIYFFIVSRYVFSAPVEVKVS